MISVIRKNVIGTRFAKVIFYIVIAAMLGLGSLLTMFKGPSTATEAIWGTINGRVITQHDFSRKAFAFEEQLQMMRAQYGQYADQLMAAMGMIANPTLLAHDALIREALINDIARDLNIEVHPDYIKHALSNIMTSYQDLGDVIPMEAIDVRSGSINEKALLKSLRQLGLSVTDFDAKVEQALKRKMATNLIASASYVPKFELENQYNAQHRAKTFSVLMIPKDEIYAEIKKDVITDKDLEFFFNRKNKERDAYMVPEKRTIQAWTISPQSYGVSISDEKISRYYEENKEKRFVAESPKVQVRKIQLKEGSAANAAQIRKDLMAKPEEFAARAKELSTDKETAANGGLMKAFVKGDTTIDRNLERGAFLLKAKGDISEPIPVKDGVVILQLVEKTPKSYKPLASVRKDIVDALTQQEFTKRFVMDMKNTYKDKDDAKLKELITQKGFTSKAKELITNDGSQLARTAFTTPLNDYAFYVDGKEGYVVHVARIQERHMPSLDTVRDTVKHDLIEDRAAALLRSRAIQAKQEAQKQPLSEVAKTYKANIKKTGPIDINNTAQIEALRKDGLPVDPMLQIENIGMLEAGVDDSYGYVIRLDELAPFKQEAFEAQRQSLVDQLGRARMMLGAQGFVASLHRNATINLNS